MYYTDDYQKRLEEKLVYHLRPSKKFKEIDLKNLNEIYLTTVKKYASEKALFPLVEYKIRNGTIKFSDATQELYLNKLDGRYKDYYDMLMSTIKWAKKHDLPIPNVTVYIWISDGYPYYIPNLSDLPIFLVSKPINFDLPLIPENTYECFQADAKYRGKCYNWDDVKHNVFKYCDKKDYEGKMPIVYFKGAPTTRYKSKLREKLAENSKSEKEIKVLIDAWQSYEPVWSFCSYKYLLDLPGNAPWSNRLKYLFLMKSNVIYINYIIHAKNYIEEPVITFVNYFIRPEDYTEIKYTYYEISKTDMNEEETKIAEEKQRQEHKNLLLQIKKAYKNMIADPKKYKDLAKKAYDNVTKLTQDRIYQYIYRAIVLLNEHDVAKTF